MNERESDLPRATAAPYTRSRRLPPCRGIIAVDAEGFTGHPAVEHEVISRAVPDLIRISLERAGLSELWNERRFPASTGDGYVLGFDPALMPFVIHPWLSTLQEVLAELNAHAPGALRIRLRVSLHIGPLPDTGDEFGGNGTVRNDTHRLLDSRPVKAALTFSRKNVTQVVAILSDRCYQDAVASGYTGRHPDHFVEVPATVEGKQFAQRAWLHVPLPSGPMRDPRAPGETSGTGRGVDGGQRERLDGPESGPTVNRAPNGNINTGTLHGDQRVSNRLVIGSRGGEERD
ncbi:hypothetical protein [Streptomyces sp. NPDC057496]|uniref:hypothetical protein n=1 Tax=Streptomyces sp. NPDC057496 TaxID=3346149 RepID=UPI0036911AD3